MELGIVTLDDEGRVLNLEGLGQTILLPIFLFSVSFIGTLTLLCEVFVESVHEISLEDG